MPREIPGCFVISGLRWRNGRCRSAPGISEIREMILRHARMEVEFKGENIAMREMRKQVAWYTAGCPHSSSLREAVNHVTADRELEELLYSRLTEQV